MYQYTNGGKIQVWEVNILKKSNNCYQIQTKHGQKNGKMIIHSKEINKGKVNRTVLEQAILEADSKWKKKHDKDGYREKFEELEKSKSDKINTKIKKVIRPMLASKFTMESLTKKSRAKNIVLPCYIQRKYDGVRCLVHIDDKDELVMETRTGVKIV